MIDLDREVTAWSQAAAAAGCASADRAAELRDHLYSEIESARARGLSDEQAFAAAVAKVGSPAQLAAEHTKNRSRVGAVCAAVTRDERLAMRNGQRGVLLSHAVIWAVLTITISFVMVRSGAREAAGWVIPCLVVPMWLSSDLLLRAALARRQSSEHR